MIRGGQRLFPVSLYATLLVALCCVAAPELPRRVQAWAQTVLCLPLRAWTVVTADSPDPHPLVDVVERLADQFERRVASAAVANVHGVIPPGLEPVICRVVARQSEGAGRIPTELVLDRSVSDLRDCAEFVTFGDHLLGFWRERVADGDPDRRARVTLLHGDDGAGPRRVTTFIETDEGMLRFLVEPAGRIDHWPLRGTMMDDPYLGSQLRRSGQAVRTVELGHDPLGLVPGGLRVGTLQVWGYPEMPRSAPIGLFVEPGLDARAVSYVVLWRPAGSPPPPPRPRLEPVPARRTVLAAPPPAEERWALTTRSGSSVPAGAAVVQGRIALGVVEQGGDGFGLASPLGDVKQRMAWVLLPELAGADPVTLVATVTRRRGYRVTLGVEAASHSLASGVLFTGANGPHCPAGLLVGRAEPTQDGRDLEVAPLPLSGGGLVIYRGEEVTPP